MPKNTDGHAFLAAISSGLRVVVLVGPLPSKDSKDAKATLSKLPGDFNLSKSHSMLSVSKRAPCGQFFYEICTSNLMRAD